MTDYSKETCIECRRKQEKWLCEYNRRGEPENAFRCDNFEPSLLCRQVRALERIAQAMEPHVVMPGPVEPSIHNISCDNCKHKSNSTYLYPCKNCCHLTTIASDPLLFEAINET